MVTPRRNLLRIDIERDSLHRQLGGGIPKGTTMVMSGRFGTGKSAVSQRLSYGFLRHGHTVTYITTELTTKGFIDQMESLDYPVREDMMEGRLTIIPVFPLIGKPISLLLSRHWATVTVCDMRTKPLSEMTKQADILVSVTGVAHLITPDMIKPGATVLDFVFAKLGDKWVGDVDYDAAKEVAGAISPVPGGTGPMTNAMLMRNTLTAAERQVRLGVKQASRVSAISLTPVPLGNAKRPGATAVD